jgi:hypothetical protein
MFRGREGGTEQTEDAMNLSAPRNITFWIAVVVAIVGLLGALVSSLGLGGFAFWLVFIAFIILAAGNLLEGL